MFTDARARLNAAFGQGSGPIILGYVQCTGSEQTLFQCQHNVLDQLGCTSHSYDAGVECIEGKQSLWHSYPLPVFVMEVAPREKFD